METLEKKKWNIKVKVITPNDVKELTQITNICPRNVGIKAIHDEFTIDARSILGWYSLNLSEPIELVFDSVYGHEEFLQKFDKWRI